MARLIDANALREAVTTDYYEHYTRFHDTDQIALVDMVCDDIDEAPTVDAVEVVRCKDCKSWIPYGPGSLGTCRNCNFSDKPITHANHFCAYGERKDND